MRGGPPAASPAHGPPACRPGRPRPWPPPPRTGETRVGLQPPRAGCLPLGRTSHLLKADFMERNGRPRAPVVPPGRPAPRSRRWPPLRPLPQRRFVSPCRPVLPLRSTLFLRSWQCLRSVLPLRCWLLFSPPLGRMRHLLLLLRVRPPRPLLPFSLSRAVTALPAAAAATAPPSLVDTPLESAPSTSAGDNALGLMAVCPTRPPRVLRGWRRRRQLQRVGAAGARRPRGCSLTVFVSCETIAFNITFVPTR